MDALLVRASPDGRKITPIRDQFESSRVKIKKLDHVPLRIPDRFTPPGESTAEALGLMMWVDEEDPYAPPLTPDHL
jgi:hypothetical protein